MRILVCDDISERGEETIAAIARGNRHHETFPAFGRQLQTAVVALFDHARTVLGGTLLSGLPGETVFAMPACDVVVLDNNLADLRRSGALLTAEALAGYVRAFTDIPYVVSLNKNSAVDFDLRYLIGDYQTLADVALNTDHFASRGLWTSQPRGAAGSFRPWYWPLLNDAPAKRRRQIDFVKNRLDDPILPTLSFSRESIDYLTRHAKGALSGDSTDDDIGRVTFRQFFVASCRSLPIRKDREMLAAGLDSDQAGDRMASRNIVARIVAAELDRWFRLDVLGPQDVLVDVPHLAMRMPFLLGRGCNTLGHWNDSVWNWKRPFGFSEGMYRSHLARARFRSSEWTGAPCFWWQSLRSDEKLNQKYTAGDQNWLDAVFCEDISSFRMFSKAGGDAGPREFKTEFESPWDRRYVALTTGRAYSPKIRFAV